MHNMKRKRLAAIFLLLCCTTVSAQYADLGTGKLREQIWWFDWSGLTISNGTTRSFTTADGLQVTFTVSKATGTTLQPSIMKTWGAAMLYSLYDFSNAAMRPALYNYGNNSNFGFTLTVTATRAGLPVPFTLVAADPEASAPNEVTTVTTSGSAWSTFDFFRNSTQTSNPAIGCGTQQVVISNTYGNIAGSLYGQNPMLTTSAPAAGSLTLDLEFDRGGAYGGMGIAIGVYSPIDRGDLPASFGSAQHRLVYAVQNSCNFNPPYPLLSQSANLKIGTLPGDADGQQTADDNAAGADEDGIATFAAYGGNGTYSVTVNVTNTTGADAYLAGWFDFNNDKVFGTGERATATIANGATTATLTWTGLPAVLPALTPATIQYFGMRFRLAARQGEAQQATGFAQDGEVEDYLAPFNIPCTFKMSAAATAAVCAGKTVQLNAAVTSGTNYNWTPATGLSNAGISNPVASPTATTTYQVTGTDSRGCADQTSVTVTVNPTPVITKGADTRICIGQSANLSVSANIPAGFTWTPAAGLSAADISNPVATPQTNTQYTVTATSGNNCTATETINVTVINKPDFKVTPVDADVCAGEAVAFTASGGDTYIWRAPDHSTIGNSAAFSTFPTASGVYTVEINDLVCARNQVFSLPVSVSQAPNTSITKSNDINCQHGSATLTASGGSQYAWDAAPGMSSTNAAQTTVSPTQPTMYYVTVTNPGGCIKRDSVLVNTNFNTTLSQYPMPNAFTPNNDGSNDCFGLKYWGPVTELDFSVFNRWGEVVFHTNNANDCWDGTFKGQPQQSGTYVFVVKAKTVCGTGERKGTVVLVR